MTEPAGDHFSWSCPACGRRVPTRFEECRCGFKKQDMPPPPPATEETAAIPERSGSSALKLVIAAAVLGLAIAGYIFQSHKTEPEPLPPDFAAIGASYERKEAPQEPVTQASETLVAPVTGSITLNRPSTNAPATSAVPSPVSASIEDVVSAALPAVASIDTGTGRGSGFFIRPDLVVTNNHVIEGQNSVTLRANGAQYT